MELIDRGILSSSSKFGETSMETTPIFLLFYDVSCMSFSMVWNFTYVDVFFMRT